MDTINLDINKTDKITECDNQFDLVVPTLEESINELSTLLVEICTKVNRHPRGYENELISVYKQYNKEESVIDYLKIFLDFKGNTIKEAINAIKENRYAIIEQSNQNWPWLLNCYADNDPSALKNNWLKKLTFREIITMKKDQIVVEDDITYQRKNFYEQCLDRISWYTDDNQFGMIRTLSFLFDIKINNFDDDAAFIVKEKIYKYDFSNYKTLNDLITDLEFGKFSQGW